MWLAPPGGTAGVRNGVSDRGARQALGGGTCQIVSHEFSCTCQILSSIAGNHDGGKEGLSLNCGVKGCSGMRCSPGQGWHSPDVPQVVAAVRQDLQSRGPNAHRHVLSTFVALYFSCVPPALMHMQGAGVRWGVSVRPLILVRNAYKVYV